MLLYIPVKDNIDKVRR